MKANYFWGERSLGEVRANVMDCEILAMSNSKLSYYVHVRTNTIGEVMNSLPPPVINKLNSSKGSFIFIFSFFDFRKNTGNFKIVY